MGANNSFYVKSNATYASTFFWYIISVLVIVDTRISFWDFLTFEAIGREVAIVNIDPANEQIPYTADVDIMNLIKLEEVMEHYKLGPNGGLIYCMEFLEKNISWLLDELTR